MSSKISTRSSGAVTTTGAPVLVGAQRHRPLVLEQIPPSPYTSRRVPTTGYRVDQVTNQNGKTTEVIIIDDTPPPTASGSGSHYDSSNRQAYEPVPKKRRNEGHTNGYGSDQPSGSSSYRNGNVAGTQDRYGGSGSGSGSGSRAAATGAKRKRDPYEGYGRREGSGGRDVSTLPCSSRRVTDSATGLSCVLPCSLRTAVLFPRCQKRKIRSRTRMATTSSARAEC